MNKAYRAKHECGLSDAKRAIEREDIMMEINTFQTISDLEKLLRRIMEFIK